MLKRLILAVSMGLATMLVPANSQASTIPYDCSACGRHNTAFDITYSVIDPTRNTYALTVTAWYQPTGAGAMDYTYINALAMKLDGVTHQNGAPSVISGPDGGAWTVGAGGLSSSGCTGSGGGYFCANSTGVGAGHSGAGDFDTWVFLLELAAPLGSTQEVHFKGHFVDSNGNKVDTLISADFWATPGGLFTPGCDGPCLPTAVPEPASLVLMGAGLSIIAVRLRKRA